MIRTEYTVIIEPADDGTFSVIREAVAEDRPTFHKLALNRALRFSEEKSAARLTSK